PPRPRGRRQPVRRDDLPVRALPSLGAARGEEAGLSAPAPPPPPAGDRDAAELARLGYAQQLLRDMGGFANFAVSFTIISILTGAIVLFGHGLNYGGPAINGLGWPIVSVFTLLVAASMAEIASAIPTAGAMYHWSSILGGPGWGWFTAWFNFIGQM